MCTALSLTTKEHYFGRNLDIDRSYGEEICIMPRRFPISFRTAGEWREHYAIMGMATLADGIPLFYDAVNEYGLAMAGLNFPKNAHYSPISEGKDNIAPFEFIPWVLCRCKNTEEAQALLLKLNLSDIVFSKEIPSAPLHWMISDRHLNIVIEAMVDGLHIHENPAGILSNNPPFEQQMDNLMKYKHLRNYNMNTAKGSDMPYTSYSQGMGAIGLPGDVSSMSRFVRMAFGRENSVCNEDEISSVGQFFHLLSSVAMLKGICKTDDETLDITAYSACINTDRGLYYYTTYNNRSISCVNMYNTDLDAGTLSRFSLLTEEKIYYQN